MKKIGLIAGIFVLCMAASFSQEIVIPMIKSIYPIECVGWSKDGYKFAYPEDQKIRIRRADDYALLQTIYTADGTINYIHFPSETGGTGLDQLTSVSAKNILETRILPTTSPINTVKLNPDSKPTVLTASRNGNYIATGSEDGAINLFLQNYMTKTLIQYPLKSESKNVFNIDFSADSVYMLSTYEDNTANIWDVASKKVIGRVPYKSEFKIPAIFSQNPMQIFSAKSKRIIGLYDHEGNELKKITSKANIQSITCSSDGKNLIILGTNNIFYFYNIETTKIEKFIPAFNKSPITSYAFTPATDKLLIGHEDGSLYIVKTSQVLLNPGEKTPQFRFEDASNKKAEEKEEEKKSDQKEIKKQEEPQKEQTQAPAGTGTQNPKADTTGKTNTKESTPKTQGTAQRTTETKVANSVVRRLLFPDMDPHSKTEHAILVSAGIGSSTKPYNMSFLLDFGYVNYGLLFPFYFGGMIEPQLSIAFADYPYTYTAIESGEKLKNPFLTGAKVYIPMGFTFFPFESDLEFFTQLQLGSSFNFIWNGNLGSQGITSKVYPCFYAGLKLGIGYRYFQFAITEEYQVMYGFTFSFEVGASIGF